MTVVGQDEIVALNARPVKPAGHGHCRAGNFRTLPLTTCRGQCRRFNGGCGQNSLPDAIQVRRGLVGLRIRVVRVRRRSCW